MPVVNMRNKRGVLPGEIRIDRKTDLGNPFPLEQDTVKGRLNCIAKFAIYLVDRLDKDAKFGKRVMELEDVTLACWCAPKLCHGHAYVYTARLLNQGLLPGYRDVLEGAVDECYRRRENG